MMILGGLVGASPHMVSASVMALARLLYEFSPQLGPTAPQLLPVVLSLLRSKSREIVQSVLGFVKVSFASLSSISNRVAQKRVLVVSNRLSSLAYAAT